MFLDWTRFLSQVKNEKREVKFSTMISYLVKEDYLEVVKDYAFLLSPFFTSISFTSLLEEERREQHLLGEEEIFVKMVLELSYYFSEKDLHCLFQSIRYFLTYLEEKHMDSSLLEKE